MSIIEVPTPEPAPVESSENALPRISSTVEPGQTAATAEEKLQGMELDATEEPNIPPSNEPTLEAPIRDGMDVDAPSTLPVRSSTFPTDSRVLHVFR